MTGLVADRVLYTRSECASILSYITRHFGQDAREVGICNPESLRNSVGKAIEKLHERKRDNPPFCAFTSSDSGALTLLARVAWGGSAKLIDNPQTAEDRELNAGYRLSLAELVGRLARIVRNQRHREASHDADT